MGLTKSARELKLIDSNGETHILKSKPGQTILETAVDNSVDLPHSCGGMGTCGTCRVKLDTGGGACPERNEVESEMALERGFAPQERLSCQVELPAESFLWTAESLGSSDEEW